MLAVDLIGTLANKADKTFAVSGSQYLDENGYDISPGGFRTLYRKRYLEYSMGNYGSDPEFYSVFSADLCSGGPGALVRGSCRHIVSTTRLFEERLSIVKQFVAR